MCFNFLLLLENKTHFKTRNSAFAEKYAPVSCIVDWEITGYFKSVEVTFQISSELNWVSFIFLTRGILDFVFW